MSCSEARSGGRRLKTAWFYISQILSIIGLAGILDDLKSWRRFAAWAYTLTVYYVPSLSVVVTTILEFIHAVAVLWRNLLHPIFDFVLAWIPFTIPVLIKDLILIVLFVSLGWVRANSVWSKAWDAEMRRMNKILEKFGVNPKELKFFGYTDAVDYLKYTGKKTASLSASRNSKVELLDRVLPGRAHELANIVVADVELKRIKLDQYKSFGVERLLKSAVIISAVTVGAFLVIDAVVIGGAWEQPRPLGVNHRIMQVTENFC